MQWKEKGFLHGNTLSLAYISDERPPNSNGVLYLMGDGGNYVGHWLGLDFPSEKHVQCPYILTPTEKIENTKCEEKWPEVFADQGCTVLDRRQ